MRTEPPGTSAMGRRASVRPVDRALDEPRDLQQQVLTARRGDEVRADRQAARALRHRERDRRLAGLVRDRGEGGEGAAASEADDGVVGCLQAPERWRELAEAR